MKQSFPLFLFTISLLFGFTVQAQSIIAQQTGYVNGWYIGLANHTYYDDGEYTEYQEAGQTFKALSTTSVATIEFYISRFDYAGDVDLEIYSCSSQNLWGSLLNTKTDIPINETGWVSVNVSSLNLSVTAGSYYGFKLIPKNDLAAGIGATTDVYSDGQCWASGGFLGGYDYPFKVTTNIILPVELVSFTAQRQNDNVLLQWSTASEQNSKNFIVQHSNNSNEWTNIGSLPAGGNSSDTRNYSFVHPKPAMGNNYYRLLQMDIDGRFSYSKIRTVFFANNQSAFSVINPVSNGLLQLQLNNATAISLYTLDGSLLWKKQFGAGKQTININDIARGLYLLKANETTEKILIQ